MVTIKGSSPQSQRGGEEREVLVAHMLDEQPLPVGFRGTPATKREDTPVRVVSE
jgi:hypothetical protein